MPSKSVTFCVSQDLETPLRIKVKSLEGHKPLLKHSQRISQPLLTQRASNVFPVSEMLVSVQVFDEERNRNMTIPLFTPYVPFKNTRKWEEWLILPISINQLNTSSWLRIIIWEFEGTKSVPFFILNTPIFNIEDNTLKRGQECLQFRYDDPQSGQKLENSALLESLNKFYLGDVRKISWLDEITVPMLTKRADKKILELGTFQLNIEFPVFELPVVFTQRTYTDVQKNIPTLHNFEQSNEVAEYNKTESRMKISTGNKYNSTLKFYDPDQFSNNPIEEKYRRLERASKRSNMDRHAKPDTKKRDYLNKLINYPPGTRLTAHEKGSIWKYRYYLVNNKKALKKLLQSTNLTEETERTEVLELMDSWAEIDIDDAIELLGPDYKNISVRAYAVNRLKKASDKELELYLLQLVQAVSFECLSTFSDKSNSEFTIVDIALSQAMDNSTSMTAQQQKMINSTNNSGESTVDESAIVISPLAEFLIRRAIMSPRLGNFFYWYMKSDSEDNPYLNQIIESFWSRLPNNRVAMLEDQIVLVDMLRDLCEEIKRLKDTTIKKMDLLHHLLNTRLKHLLKNREISLPIDPDIIVVDVLPEMSKVFKSSLSPLKLAFKTKTGSCYSLMYKVGDDLRQDQLVVQIISLMNELLMNENVDLKLIPYKILATGPQEGAIQFIPNDTMANILSVHHGILPYLRSHYPDDTAELGVQDWVMDNFVKSCAGYCVITYILGVGDRHLDNLLITPDGHFFHADFGYILGQDPKPFPPLMKLPPQIIEAFGGAESSNYNKFRSYCFVVYSILRRNAGLILNLFELMKTSNIPDIRIDPDGAVLKVKERFNLDMSEEEATVHFQNLINDSVNALLPIVIDHLHNLAQYWRA
ncbi:probable Phosphatidylinositol 3-kinase VPS34 [Zygosaccharomyces bailii]|nr:probable Phosphatidylinositol 3-kinase VPS34 [Zygosaccharomyces bailii]